MRAGGIVVLGVLARVAHADATLDKPAFTATPSELIAAAKTKPVGATDAFILREDEDVAFDDKGRVTTHWHMIFVVTSQAGADDWGSLGAGWVPAYQDKPTVKARVIDPNAKVTDLDQGRITEAASWPNTVVAGSRRQLEAALPRLQVGSIVEEEIVTTDREPYVGGTIEAFRLTSSVPVVSARYVVSAPSKRKLHVNPRNIKLKPKQETSGGRQRLTFAAGPFPVDDERESNMPPDVVTAKYIEASVGESWNAVAREYRGVIEKKLGEGPVALPPDLAQKTASMETLAAIVAWIHRTVKTDDLEFGEGSLVPSTPAETLKRGQADAKDKALLIVSALRQVGITAELALVANGLELDRDSFGMTGFAEVLVRARVGGNDIWIEPSDRSARVGQVPSHLQGRQMLIIADATTALARMPQSSMKDNVASEVRTFDLVESGHPKVTEVSHSTGTFESYDRSSFGDATSDSVRKHLEQYVANEYSGAKLEQVTATASDDFTKPFELTLVTSGSKSAHSDREGADVYLYPTPVLVRLPSALGQPADNERVRKFDLWVSAPYTQQVENRIVIPEGFKMPTAVAEQTRDLGPLKLVEQQRVDGKTFVVSFRLDVPKQRFTPGEVTTIQEAVRKLRKDNARTIDITTTAKSLENDGKYKDALAEAQRMIALHPKEAIHQSQLAMILLDVGAGEAARRAAKKAVALEPSDGDAAVVLGWVLAHDTFGKLRGFDHDRAGAIAALQKAHKLDPKHVGAAVELARMLERGPSGHKYDEGADVPASIAAWRDALALDNSDENALGLARALLVTGDAAQAETVVRARPESEERNGLLVASMAMGKSGAKAAMATASSLASGQARSKIVSTVMLMLMVARKYDELRAFIAEAGQSNPAYDQLLKTLRRSEALPKLASPAEQAALDSVLVASATAKNSVVFLDKRVADEVVKISSKTLKGFSADTFNVRAVEDLFRSGANVKSDVEGAFTHVELDVVGFKSHVYVISDKTKTKVFGTSEAPQGVGRQVLTLLQHNDEKTALRLLDWVAADLQGNQQSLGKAFPFFWASGMPRTRPAMELAAAFLTGDSDYGRTQPIVKRCGATSKEGQIMCDIMLADALKKAANWSELAEVAEAWMTLVPKNNLPVKTRVTALLHLGQFDQADQVLADARKAMPDDERLVYEQVEIDFARGKPAQAVTDAEALATKSSPTAYGLNEAAWIKFVAGSDLPNARLEARRSITIDAGYPGLNTIAAIDAEVGELKDAHEHLAESMRVGGQDTPIVGDWYVQGRILEQLGLRDDAIAAYRQAHTKLHDGFTPGSEELAKQRLKALGAKP